MLAVLIVVVALALIFSYVNGFHDAAATVATSVATRALTPGSAIALAAGFNLLGALVGSGIAAIIGGGIVVPGEGVRALVVVGCALLGAILWDLLTWWGGVPSSSSHALIGGLAGAGLAAGVRVEWSVIGWLVALPMVLVPIIALTLSATLTTAIFWGWRDSSPGRSHRLFEQLQTMSCAALSLGHGLQDAQKAMGAIVLALVAAGEHTGLAVPLWVRLASAAALAAGTAAGGWRIIRTLGRRLADLDSPRGFAAEAVAAGLLYASAYGLGAPISTTHVLTASVVGASMTRRRSAVRWRVLRDIMVAWVATPVVAGVLAAIGVVTVQAFGLT